MPINTINKTPFDVFVTPRGSLVCNSKRRRGFESKNNHTGETIDGKRSENSVDYQTRIKSFELGWPQNPLNP